MKKITKEEYDKINERSSSFTLGVEPRFKFTFDEVQDFLNRKGYNIVVHRAEKTVIHRTYNMGGGTERQWEADEMVTQVIAVKEGEQLPDNFNHKNYWDIGHDIVSVFNNELKKTILA